MIKGHIISSRKTGFFGSRTVSSTAGGFPTDKINPATGPFAGKKCREVFCTVEGDQIRYTLEGTDPATGHLLNVGDSLTISNPDDIQNYQDVRVTGDAVMRVSYKF